MNFKKIIAPLFLTATLGAGAAVIGANVLETSGIKSSSETSMQYGGKAGCILSCPK